MKTHNRKTFLLMVLLLAGVIPTTPRVQAQQSVALPSPHASATEVRQWHLHPESPAHFPEFPERVGISIVDDGAEYDRENGNINGPNAWRVVQGDPGLVCAQVAFRIPENARGSSLSVSLRLRIPEAPFTDGVARPVVRVRVIEAGVVRIEQLVTTASPRSTTSSSESEAKLGSACTYGLVTVGSWRFEGNKIDIQVEALGAVSFILDCIEISDGSVRQ